MSLEMKEIGIAGYRVDRIEEYRYHSVLHLCLLSGRRPACPCCKSEGASDERSESGRLEIYSKGPYLRRVRHLDSFGRDIHLKIHTHRYQCRRCGKSFIPPLPGIKPYRHSSEPYRQDIYQRHRDGIVT